MTSSRKKYMRIFEKFKHCQIHSFCQGVFVYCKALPVRVGYQHDVTGGMISSMVYCYNAQRRICCNSLIALRRQIELHFYPI